MEALIQPNDYVSEMPLHLLLFIDKRPSVNDHIRKIRHHLQDLKGEHGFHLEIIDVSEQPYLVEHFKLVATPALVKLSPTPRQTLAGTDIISQLNHWWPKWQQEVSWEQADFQGQPEVDQPNNYRESIRSITHSAELIKLSDEIFRLKQEREELSSQLRFKDRIIAMLAHDLRNPLTAASIAIETLELGYDSHKKQRLQKMKPELMAQLLTHAKTQIRSIDRMITDILQAARGTCGELQIRPQALDLRLLCCDVLESLQPKFEAKSLKITTDIPQDLPRVYADPGPIHQVVVNLLDNAVKYTPAGGGVEIMALHRTTQKVQVTIHDTGPGIPKENRERIFEESFRLERDEKKDGYGLGLSLCQRIIRAHYGQIWVDSVPNQGSFFHFTLPVYHN